MRIYKALYENGKSEVFYDSTDKGAIERAEELEEFYGKITSFSEITGCRKERKICIEDNAMTKQNLFEKYGYLMDEEHGEDEELLCDILKEVGYEVHEENGLYYVL